ncbi:MAG: hypothetical protein K6E78_09835 [Treponema sp.]|nr:hypothetical protein [Treponema sp.]
MVRVFQKKHKNNFLLSLKGIIKEPVILSAVIVSIMVYSGLFSVKEKEDLKSLCQFEKISVIEGRVSSNPVKNQKNNSYSFLLKVNRISSGNMDLKKGGKVAQRVAREKKMAEANSLTLENGLEEIMLQIF